MIAAALVEPDVIPLISTVITASDFFREKNGWIWEAIRRVHNRSEEATQVTVAHELRAMKHLKDVGGMAYLSRIIADLPTTVGSETNANIIRRCSVYRSLISAAHQIAQAGYEANGDLEGTLSKASTHLQAVMEQGIGDRKGLSLRDLMHQLANEKPAQEQGVLTGWPRLNQYLGSLRRGRVYVMAALTARGKSAWLANLLRDVILSGHKSPLLFSLEMTTEEFGHRLVACDSGVNATKIAQHSYTDEQQAAVNESIGSFGDMDGWLVDDIFDIAGIEAYAKSRQVKHRVDLVAIDYLQLIEGPKRDSRSQEVAAVTRRLKRLAKDMNVPIVHLAQLNRSAEDRIKQRPKLSHLRESGTIEQDADVVMFLHERSSGGDPRDMDLIVAKNRQGPTGEFAMTFRPEISRFEGRP